MKRENGIDLFRFIGAFLVVLLHTSGYTVKNYSFMSYVLIFARWAVPFFFITSGYFLGLKILKSNDVSLRLIDSNIIKLLGAIFISDLIYFPYDAYKRGEFSYTSKVFLEGTSFHLWFLGSLLFGYIIVWFMYYYKWEKLLPYLSVGIFFIMIVADSYDTFFGVKLKYEFPRFLSSIPFLYVGIYFSKQKKVQRPIGIHTLYIILAIIILFVEAHFINQFTGKKNVHEMVIFTIVLSVLIFKYCISIDIKENLFTRLGKKYSLFIYMYHILIGTLSFFLFKFMFEDLTWYIYFPLLVFCLTLGLGILINKYNNRLFLILNGVLRKDHEKTIN